MLISAIIPISSFNYRLDRLALWLPGVIGENFDLIFVHDISNPNFDSSLKDSISKLFHEEFQFIEGIFGNPGSARNAGLLRAKGDWITFWDSDDAIDTSAVRSLVLAASRNGAEIAMAPFYVVQNESKPELIAITSGNSREIAPHPGIWRFVFHKNAIGENIFPELRMGEDQVFLLNCHIYGKKIEIGCTPTYTYFKGNSGQLTTDLDGIGDLMKVRKLVEDICLNSNGEDLKLALRFHFRQSMSLLKYRKKMGTNIAKLDLLKFYISHPLILTGEFLRMVKSSSCG